MVKVNESVRGPKSGPKLLAGDDLTRILEQDGQDLEGLVLELDLLAVLAQFGGGKVGLENTETHGAVILRLGHCDLSN
jgi:hypothetical protein